MEIEKIYIINTGESTEAVQANLVSKLNQCSFVEETGFEIININQFHNGMPDGYAMGPVEMTQAEIDEAITNRLIWEKIIFDGKDKVLILRDDFLCTTNMADYSLPDDSVRWDIAILNRNDLTDNTLINIDDNWVRPQTFNTTSTAYMLNKSTTASLLLSGGLKTNVVPIDQYLSAISYPYIANTAVQDIFKPGLESIGTKNPKMITRTDEVVSQIPAPIKIDASTQEYFEILDDSDWDAWKLKYLNLSVAKGEWDLMVDDLGDNIYEFIFSDTLEVFGENWESSPANGYPLPPDMEYIKKVGTLINEEITFELVQNSDVFSVIDSMDGVIALGWEKESEDKDFSIIKRLVFHFGETEDSVKDKLYERDIVLQFEKEVVYEK